MEGGLAQNIQMPMENVPAPAAHLSEKPAQPTENPSLEAVKDVVYGSIAGIAGKLIEYPFDTIKVRLQSQPSGLPLQYHGPLDCFQQSFRHGGIYSLYRGIGAPMFGAAVETSGLFFSYRIAQEVLQKKLYRHHPDADDAKPVELPLHMLLLCGSASGAFTSLLLTPVELVKCKMQVPSSSGHGHGHRHAPGPMQIISQIFRQSGVLGFWRGQMGTLIRETGGSAAWFGAYEGVSLFFKNQIRRAETSSESRDLKTIQLPLYQQMLAGAAAGVSYNFTFYPADTIKSRLQTEDVRGKGQGQGAGAGAGAVAKRTFWTVGKTLYMKRGVKGLYQGCGITCARAAPSSAFIFTVYEALRYYFG
ncbi:hypothetical protein KEM56_002606 [Ascosphaera pollenicola]|nr:hypothetical protein KEM56_002606 [Ascosphaera pollenicola]